MCNLLEANEKRVEKVNKKFFELKRDISWDSGMHDRAITPWGGRVYRDGYRDQIVTRLHSVMWVCLCIPRHIHCSCSTVMALSCIPLSQLVSYNPYMSLFNSFLLAHL